MSSWRLIFLQRKANDGSYDEEELPQQNWTWPQGTWFQDGYATSETPTGGFSKE